MKRQENVYKRNRNSLVNEKPHIKKYNSNVKTIKTKYK